MKLFCVVDQLIESGDIEKAGELTIIAPVEAILRMSNSLLNEITGRLVVVSADATIPSRTAARVAHDGSGHAGTVDHYPACATAHTGLRDHAVNLVASNTISAAAICSAVHSPVDARNTPRCQRPTYSCFREIQRD